MSDIRFYHLTRRTADQALPELADRAYSKGHKIVIRCGEADEVERLNAHLWGFNPDAFLPHGSAKDGYSSHQPIYLTCQNDNPAGADVLILMPGAAADTIDGYALCCTFVDGNNPEQVTAARGLWTQWKTAGHTMTYWQQSDQGKWEQKS